MCVAQQSDDERNKEKVCGLRVRRTVVGDVRLVKTV